MKTHLKCIACTSMMLVATALQPASGQTNSDAAAASGGKTEGKAPAPRKVDVTKFEKLWQDKHNIVLDVRTPKEFAAGHIPGATNVDISAPDFEQKLRALSKDKTYLVHCASGGRSARACDKMNRLGFEHLVDLAPGFKGWEKAGKPVEK